MAAFGTKSAVENNTIEVENSQYLEWTGPTFLRLFILTLQGFNQFKRHCVRDANDCRNTPYDGDDKSGVGFTTAEL